MIEFFQFQQHIRNFFAKKQFQEISCPPAVTHPGIEPHIHPIGAYSYTNKTPISDMYFHTSPEFFMKDLLSQGMEKIFTFSFSFRDEPQSPLHRKQFLMLEWYQAHASWKDTMNLCHELLDDLLTKEPSSDSQYSSPHCLTVEELFQKTIQCPILDLLTKDKLYNYLQTHHRELLPSSSHHFEWDDLFFLLFLNKVEPLLRSLGSLFLHHFPAPLAALAEINSQDPRTCLRFEWYIDGIEIGNCFQELTDYHEQKKRAEQDLNKKKKLYGMILPPPEHLYKTLQRGLPQSSGIAIGVERLFQRVKKQDHFFLSSF